MHELIDWQRTLEALVEEERAARPGSERALVSFAYAHALVALAPETGVPSAIYRFVMETFEQAVPQLCANGLPDQYKREMVRMASFVEQVRGVVAGEKSYFASAEDDAPVTIDGTVLNARLTGFAKGLYAAVHERREKKRVVESAVGDLYVGIAELLEKDEAAPLCALLRDHSPLCGFTSMAAGRYDQLFERAAGEVRLLYARIERSTDLKTPEDAFDALDVGNAPVN